MDPTQPRQHPTPAKCRDLHASSLPLGREEKAEVERVVQGGACGEGWAGGHDNNFQSSGGSVWQGSPGCQLRTSGGRGKLEKAGIRSLKNSNSPGFLATLEAMSPHFQLFKQSLRNHLLKTASL